MSNVNPKPVVLMVIFIIAMFFARVLTPQIVKSVSFPAVDDAMVSSAYPYKNYGSQPDASVVRSSTESTLVYLRFVFSLPEDFESLKELKLIINVEYVLYGEDPTYGIYLAEAGVQWSEDQITYNNRPALTDFSQSATIKSTGVHKLALDTIIIPIIAFQQKTGEVTLVLKKETVTTDFFTMTTKEGDFAPKLKMTYVVGVQPFTFNVIVKDQVGNPLPARVYVADVTETCSPKGECTVNFNTYPNTTVKVTAEIKVGEKTFSATHEVLAGNKTITITITRRFLWNFTITYTDGTPADGTLTAKSAIETIDIPVTNGKGQAYLMNYKYELVFTASPEVTIGVLDVKNDGYYNVVINPQTSQVTSIQTSETAVSTTPPPIPELPWYLIPGVYIYALIGVILFIGIISNC